MKICVFGAGAIGGYFAAQLAQVSGLEVSVVARGEHLAAIKENGLRLDSPKGVLRASIPATDRPVELGRQDVVFVALKSHQIDAALDGISALLGPDTIVLPPTTGLPYWYFHGLEGPFKNRRVERLDPGGRQWRAMAPERVIGCVYWVAAEVASPGVIRHDGSLSRFPIGEPHGASSARINYLAKAFAAAGLDAPIVPDIRAWIWAKMISSLTWNPIACLTGATLAELTARPEIISIVRRVMSEADHLALRLGVERMPISIDERIDAARRAGAHKMSMLQDLERRRPIEMDVLVDSLTAMREIAGVSTPLIDDFFALLKMRAGVVAAASRSISPLSSRSI
jgi:2-dehydropantoate 2-reductase